MNKMKYRMIYFFGPDGTGKTTHANLISLWLRRKGCMVWRTSIKHHHTLSFLFLKILNYRIKSLESLKYYGFDNVLTKKIRTPWKILEMMSLFPAIFYRVILPLSLGYTVICDRYVIDTIVVLSYFLKDPKMVSGMYVKLMTMMFPKETLLFYFDAETEVILQRKRDEPLSADLIKYYRMAYETVVMQLSGKNLSVTHINTDAYSINNIQNLIRSYLDYPL